MSPPTPARSLPFFRDTPYVPTAPIPIPHIRRVTDPPPRSPTRHQSSPDLIFEMSPHVPNETPLFQHKPIPGSDSASAYFTRTSHVPSANRVGCAMSPYVNLPPYWEEPFLYSIPRLPTRPPQFHSRTRSAVVNGTRYSEHQDCEKKEVPDLATAFPSTFSIKSLSPAEVRSASCSDTSNSDQEQEEVLTNAFQQSFVSSSSSQSSTSEGRRITRSAYLV